eukprot:TRINITY_DN6852_c0_g1_i1.p1 TRINITY_DN6852_c0_g1~~TRINITY_DN6852_c0_g1_i1.p1  ORF type:complete len:187 (-),score=0.33 TRINITY_DN6852_c0_g1_i1:308-868(-)
MRHVHRPPGHTTTIYIEFQMAEPPSRTTSRQTRDQSDGVSAPRSSARLHQSAITNIRNILATHKTSHDKLPRKSSSTQLASDPALNQTDHIPSRNTPDRPPSRSERESEGYSEEGSRVRINRSQDRVVKDRNPKAAGLDRSSSVKAPTQQRAKQREDYQTESYDSHETRSPPTRPHHHDLHRISNG